MFIVAKTNIYYLNPSKFLNAATQLDTIAHGQMVYRGIPYPSSSCGFPSAVARLGGFIIITTDGRHGRGDWFEFRQWMYEIFWSMLTADADSLECKCAWEVLTSRENSDPGDALVGLMHVGNTGPITDHFKEWAKAFGHTIL